MARTHFSAPAGPGSGGSLRRFALLLSLALALAACGGGGGEDAAGDGATGGDPTAAETMAEETGGEATATGEPTDGETAAASAWTPERDIEVIVPYTPGGGFDTYARGVAEVMGANLPVNMVVDNVTPTQEGLNAMFEAEPDGYTLGILPMPAAIVQQIGYPEVSPWETSEFTVIGGVDENAYVVYVAADSPYETIDDLIAAEGLQALTVERGSSSSVAAAVAIEELGLDAELLYGAEGSQEVATAVLRGDVDFFVYGATDVIGLIESGDVRPLLFLGTEEQRSPELEWLQEVPGAADAGFPEAAGVVSELRIIVGPPDIPEDVTTYLRDEMQAAITSDAFAQWAADAGRPIVPRSAEDAEAAMQAQIERMRELVPTLLEEGTL